MKKKGKRKPIIELFQLPGVELYKGKGYSVSVRNHSKHSFHLSSFLRIHLLPGSSVLNLLVGIVQRMEK